MASTARKAAEDSARYIHEQAELMRVTFTSIVEAIIATDAAGIVHLVNLEAQRLSGLSESRLLVLGSGAILAVDVPSGEVAYTLGEVKAPVALSPGFANDGHETV